MVRKMQQTSLKNEGISRIAMLGLVGAGTAVILTLLLAPWNWMPTEYAEEITVIAVTDYGCVGESQVGNSVVVSDCSASAVSYTHLRAHETREDLVCRLLLEKKK